MTICQQIRHVSNQLSYTPYYADSQKRRETVILQRTKRTKRSRRQRSGRFLTFFSRVGTAGMERDYSWSLVPFQAVCVHFDFQATEQPTRTENNPTDFFGGTAQLDPKTGVPSGRQRVLLTQRMTFGQHCCERQALHNKDSVDCRFSTK